jgi:transcriptional regulator with XRE-family HTH domain
MLDKSTFSDKLKQYRLRQRWTQEQMATITGLTKSAICKLENGDSNPTDLTIAKIIHALPDFESAA